MWVGVLDCPLGRLTSRSVIRLVGPTTVEPAPSRPHGSLQRAAHEAEVTHNKTLQDRGRRREHRRRIDFGCPVPFTNIPKLILSGFKEARAIFSRKGGDTKVLDHYQLMLIITLIVCASSETPQVAPKEQAFSVAPRRKDHRLLALALQKNSGGTTHNVAKITKKIKYRGYSNQMLRALG
ncbi:hypothetical protein LX36DRAFT_663659 [Colletotrichum falcatum]|nr:hypothetical protein LX36DRAFT_663659 [Colletotrichum falcatum]